MLRQADRQDIYLTPFLPFMKKLNMSSVKLIIHLQEKIDRHF